VADIVGVMIALDVDGVEALDVVDEWEKSSRRRNRTMMATMKQYVIISEEVVLRLSRPRKMEM
jgi:hypothetical protein